MAPHMALGCTSPTAAHLGLRNAASLVNCNCVGGRSLAVTRSQLGLTAAPRAPMLQQIHRPAPQSAVLASSAASEFHSSGAGHDDPAQQESATKNQSKQSSEDNSRVAVDEASTSLPWYRSRAVVMGIRCLALVAVLCALSCIVPERFAVKASATASVATTEAVSAPAAPNPIMTIVNFILRIDHHLGVMVERSPFRTYFILWGIVFCETGLVITPFLPGDSLLFAAGAFAGMGKLNLAILLATFVTAAILGDAANYAIGNTLGRAAINKGIISKKDISKTEKFYEQHGGKTVVLARFVPIVRTFAPFVAGIGEMAYKTFAAYNVFGALLWVTSFVGIGFFFGNLPFVHKNFTAVVIGIVLVSVVPVIIELIQAGREAQQEKKEQGGTT